VGNIPKIGGVDLTTTTASQVPYFENALAMGLYPTFKE
jgi:hypothetical protein